MPVYNSGHQEVMPNGTARPWPPGLRATGPVIPVQVEIPPALAEQIESKGEATPAPKTGFAIIDTGASVSAVDEEVIKGLGVQPVGVLAISTPSGPDQRELYPGRLTFPGTGLPSIDHQQLLGAVLAGPTSLGPKHQYIALIGRDILQRFVLIYNGPGATVTLSV